MNIKNIYTQLNKVQNLQIRKDLSFSLRVNEFFYDATDDKIKYAIQISGEYRKHGFNMVFGNDAFYAEEGSVWLYNFYFDEIKCFDKIKKYIRIGLGNHQGVDEKGAFIYELKPRTENDILTILSKIFEKYLYERMEDINEDIARKINSKVEQEAKEIVRLELEKETANLEIKKARMEQEALKELEPKVEIKSVIHDINLFNVIKEPEKYSLIEIKK